MGLVLPGNYSLPACDPRVAITSPFEHACLAILHQDACLVLTGGASTNSTIRQLSADLFASPLMLPRIRPKLAVPDENIAKVYDGLVVET